MYTLPDGFDMSGGWDEGSEPSPDISDAMTDAGYDSWSDIILPNDAVINGDIRPGEYMTPQDAIMDYADHDLLDYIALIWDDDLEAWIVVVEHDSP